jgi:hypothetical protein
LKNIYPNAGQGTQTRTKLLKVAVTSKQVVGVKNIKKHSLSISLVKSPPPVPLSKKNKKIKYKPLKGR